MASIIAMVKTRLSPTRRIQSDIQKMYRARNKGSILLAKLINNRIYYRYNCCIAIHSDIDPSVLFPHPVGVVIGEGVVVGPGCTVYQNVTLGLKKLDQNLYPRLEEHCIVYAGACVFGNCLIRRGTTIAAGTVVMDLNCEEDDLLVGMPARSKKKA